MMMKITGVLIKIIEINITPRMITSLSPKIRKNTVTEKELNRDAREQKVNNKLFPTASKRDFENKDITNYIM
jgi:hypothetical protein